MRRLQKSQCGYELYKCKGINLLPPPLPICCSNAATPTSRSNDNNFYNIPSRLLGIVQQTTYIDLSLLRSNSICCDFRYDPFDPSGFNDLFDQVKGKIGNYNSLANYGCSNSSYGTSDAILKPGFLLPTPLLNDFYPPVLLAIPTVALASPVANINYNSGSPTKSSCTGFRISADLVSDVLNCNVAPGKALITSNWSLSFEGLVWTQNIPTNTVVEVKVFLIVNYDLQQQRWLGGIAHRTDDLLPLSPNSFSKFFQLGTIRVLKRVVQIIQSLCSPIDARDWVSQVDLPLNLGLYLFSYQGGSTRMNWFPVKDC